MKFKFSNLGTLIALALSGASALIYEVVATDTLFFYFIKSSYSIATVLAVFLLGLGIGSLVIYKLSPKIKNKRVLFGILQILIAVYAVFVLANLTGVIPKISTLGIFAASFVILLFPTIFLGAVFPLAGSIIIRRKKEIIGLVYSSDLFGAILGVLIAGFLLIPTFGHKITVLVGAGLNLVSAFIIFPKIKKLWILWVIFVLILGFNFPGPILKGVLNLSPGKEYQFYANSPYGVIEVKNQGLFIDERIQCSFNDPEDSPEIMMVDYALEPLESKEVNTLNIGLGCGLTLSRILDMVNASVDIVEINPVVVRANKEFSDVLEDKRVNLIIDEGLRYLRRSEKKYNSILIDVENPAVIHSSNLYTVEAFKIVYNSLTRNGTFALFSFGKKGRFLDILYYSLKEAFPFVYSYTNVLLASKQKLDQREYIASGHYEVNTIDKNTLIKAYLEE